MPVQIGQQAPDFQLQDTTLNMVTLGSFRGENLLILFYPLAFSGVCTKELCAVRDDLSKYASLKTRILAISVDSPFALARFKEDQGLSFHLLSDFNKEVSALYDSLYSNYFGMKGVSKRSAFVIDAKGLVRHAEVLEDDGKLPDFGAIEATLLALQ